MKSNTDRGKVIPLIFCPLQVGDQLPRIASLTQTKSMLGKVAFAARQHQTPITRETKQGNVILRWNFTAGIMPATYDLSVGRELKWKLQVQDPTATIVDKMPFVSRIKHTSMSELVRNRRMQIGAGLSLVGGAYVVKHLDRHPLTKRIRYRSKSQEDARIQSKAMIAGVKDAFPYAFSNQLSAYPVVSEIFLQLVSAAKLGTEVRPQLYILRGDPDPRSNPFAFLPKCVLRNAMAHPDGTILLAEEALLRLQERFGAQWPDAVAFILAHELAHVELEHGSEKLSYDQAASYGKGIGLVAGVGLPAYLGMDAVVNYNSRQLEYEADDRGVQLLQIAGFHLDSALLGRVISDLVDLDLQNKAVNSMANFAFQGFGLSTHPIASLRGWRTGRQADAYNRAFPSNGRPYDFTPSETETPDDEVDPTDTDLTFGSDKILRE